MSSDREEKQTFCWRNSHLSCSAPRGSWLAAWMRELFSISAELLMCSRELLKGSSPLLLTCSRELFRRSAEASGRAAPRGCSVKLEGVRPRGEGWCGRLRVGLAVLRL